MLAVCCLARAAEPERFVQQEGALIYLEGYRADADPALARIYGRCAAIGIWLLRVTE